MKALSKLLEGKRVCRNCLVKDPANLEECAGCGRRRPVAVRDGATVWCVSCRPRQIIGCGICGRKARGEVSRATGQPWCDRCQQWRASCSGCGVTAPVRGGTRREPLCARCVNPDPAFWSRCPSCGQTWQMSTRPCQRCLVAENVHGLLGGKDGIIRPALALLYQALAGAERPGSALAWVTRPRTRGLLEKIGTEERDHAHEVLGELPAGKALARLRSVLAAAGALPERDEILTRLEQRVAETARAGEDPGERRILHGYATWHHLRKLRHRLRGSPATCRTAPVTLPGPLDGLVRELAATHRGHAAIGRPGTTAWLFPGGRPGQHTGYDSLCARLKNIGLSPQQDRSTALSALAAELPAAILARMPGIHIAVAVQWRRAAPGDWGAYAADVSRRTTRSQERCPRLPECQEQ